MWNHHRLQLFENGVVRTLDPANPIGSWVLVEGGKVLRVGRGQALVASHVERFDLGGRTLVPGFTDAHVHLTWMATSFMGPDLSGSENVESVLAAVRAWQGEGRGEDGAWIAGDGFDESTWTDKRLPTRHEIDAVEKGRPVLIRRVCGHVGVLNSQALARVVPGPHTNADTGRIAETDLWALNDRLRPSPEQLVRVLPQVFALLHAHGITAVHDVISAEMLRALQMQRNRGLLPLRVSCSLPADRLEALRSCGLQSGFGDEWLEVLGIKVFVDGSLGARTAWLREPYSDDPTTRGTPLYTQEALAALFAAGDAVGAQLMIHAIGDAALERVLDCMPPHIAADNPLRHRLEHVEVTPPDLLQRLAVSGLHACVQPNFAGRWSQPGGMNEQRLGPRMPHCNAYRALADAGVPLGFGSDCMPLGALDGLRAAVRHPDAAQRLDPLQALDLYTRAAAFLRRAETVHGQIRPGLAADFALLSHDPGTEAGIAGARVEATFLAGARVGGGALGSER